MRVTWNAFLWTVSVVMLLFQLGLGLVESVALAEALSPQLAAELEVDEALVRGQLQTLVGELAVWRTVVSCTPMAILSFLLLTRIVGECVAAFSDGWRGKAEL